MPAHVCAQLLDHGSTHVAPGTYHQLYEPHDVVLPTNTIDLPTLGLKWHVRGELRRCLMSQGWVDFNAEVMEIMDMKTFAAARLMYDM
jgi:hypothetical protein